MTTPRSLHSQAREPRLLSGQVILTGGFCLATARLQGPLTSDGSPCPGWAPGGEILIWIARDTVKDKLIRAAGRFSFAVHNETQSYKYVTAEGPVVSNDEQPMREQALQLVRRCAPEEDAVAYVDSALGERSVLVRMRPERWLSNDQSRTR